MGAVKAHFEAFAQKREDNNDALRRDLKGGFEIIKGDLGSMRCDIIELKRGLIDYVYQNLHKIQTTNSKPIINQIQCLISTS